MAMFLIFYQFQGPAITPPYAGGAWWDATKIAFQGKAGLSLNKKRFFRARGPADQAHIVSLTADDQIVLGCTGGVYKWTGNSWKIGMSLSKYPDPGPSGIGRASHVI